MALIEAVRHEDNGTYQFIVNGHTWYDDVRTEAAMETLAHIVDGFNCRGENYEIVIHI